MSIEEEPKGTFKKKKLSKSERKFAKTLAKAAKTRRSEIETIAQLDPLLKAFFTKGYKG